MGKLDGKTALITGGSSGIGLAAAKRFVDEGAYVFITGRGEADLASAAKDIGKNVKALNGDVSNLDDLDRIVAQIKETKGKLDIVFAQSFLPNRCEPRSAHLAAALRTYRRPISAPRRSVQRSRVPEFVLMKWRQL